MYTMFAWLLTTSIKQTISFTKTSNWSDKRLEVYFSTKAKAKVSDKTGRFKSLPFPQWKTIWKRESIPCLTHTMFDETFLLAGMY